MAGKENVKRIVSLIAGVIVLLGMGSLYSFSGYSTVLKARMNYTETELNTVSAIGDMGLYIGALPVGFLYDRFGPRVTFVGAITLIWLGYFLMYQATSYNIAGSSVLMGIYFFFAGSGSIFGFNGAVVTNIKNFPMQHKGKISGALYGGFGLSAAIVTQMFKMFFYNAETSHYNIEGFFLALSFLLSGLAIVGLALVQKVNMNSHETKPLLSQDETGEKTEQPVVEKKEHVGIYGALGLSRLWRHSAFIVLFFAFILAAGAGLTFINILGGVIKSWQVTQLDSTKFVIILSLSNFVGRVLVGNLIDVLQKVMPAGAVLIFPAALMAVSHTLLALFPTFVVLLIGTIGSTIAYGAFWAGFNYLLSAYFGDKYLGQNLGAIALGAGASSLILNVIAGRIYDAQTTGEGDSHQCYGDMCYRYTFFITAAMSIVATVLVVGMTIQEGRRKKYLRVIN